MSSRSKPLVECFSEVVDPRDSKWVQHDLSDILALAVLAVIAGAEGWEDIDVTGTRNLGVSEPEVLRVLHLVNFCGLGRLRRPDSQNRQLCSSSGI